VIKWKGSVHLRPVSPAVRDRLPEVQELLDPGHLLGCGLLKGLAPPTPAQIPLHLSDVGEPLVV